MQKYLGLTILTLTLAIAMANVDAPTSQTTVHTTIPTPVQVPIDTGVQRHITGIPALHPHIIAKSTDLVMVTPTFTVDDVKVFIAHHSVFHASQAGNAVALSVTFITSKEACRRLGIESLDRPANALIAWVVVQADVTFHGQGGPIVANRVDEVFDAYTGNYLGMVAEKP